MYLIKLCETREYPPQVLEHWLHTVQKRKKSFEIFLINRDGKVELLCSEDLSHHFPHSSVRKIDDVNSLTLRLKFWVAQTKGPLLPIRRLSQFENQLEKERLTPLNVLLPLLAKTENSCLRFSFHALPERTRERLVKKVQKNNFEPQRRFDQWESRGWLGISWRRFFGPLFRYFFFHSNPPKTQAFEQTETRHEKEDPKRAVLDKLSRPLFQVQIGMSHSFHEYFHGFNLPYLGALKIQKMTARILLSAEEIASLLAPPNVKEAAPYLLTEPTADLPCSLINPLAFPEEDRKRHLYIVGKTGMGKSTLLLHLISQDAQQNFPILLMDPHGDLVEDALRVIPEHRHKDILIVDPSDSDNPLALNPLELKEGGSASLQASSLVEMFAALSKGSWGPRLEYILRNTLIALILSPNSTLLDLPNWLLHPDYAKSKLPMIPDPEIRRFFQDEFFSLEERTRQEFIAPILNKVGPLLTLPQLRNILGQPKGKIDFESLFRENRILLVNLSKGKLGEDGSRMLGMILLSLLQSTLLRRSKIAPEDRKTVSVLLDEFQNFTTPTLLSMLSESRKYGLALTLAHQYLTQLPPEIQDAVIGNVGSLFCFRLSQQDAEHIAPSLNLSENDLTGLHPFQVYAQCLRKQKRVPVFRLDLEKAPQIVPPEITLLKQKSVERLARKKSLVEAKIQERYNVANRTLHAKTPRRSNCPASAVFAKCSTGTGRGLSKF